MNEQLTHCELFQTVDKYNNVLNIIHSSSDLLLQYILSFLVML